MIRKTVLLLVPCVMMGFFSNAQKVKYKDLILLLNAKEYDKAEPFLKKYLKDNDDNPNAFLNMGIIYHEKANRNDVLKQTEILAANIDSAVIFYDKAYKTITEKEIRRNDEYYESYKRRDLRTGDFGIKLSDVQFDLEKRIQGLKEKKERVKLLKDYYVTAEAQYQKANSRFKKLQQTFGSVKDFYLQSSESTLTELKHIADSFDSCKTAFANYKSTSQLLGKTGYNQVLDLVEIKDFKKDGANLTDFTKDDLKLWDYKKWADAAGETVEKQIIPIRDYLIASDMEINKLRAKIKKDSVSVKGEIASLLDRPLFKQLKKFDPDPLPLAVFAMKVAELDYASDLIKYKGVKDSLNVNVRLNAIQAELKSVGVLDSLSTILTSRDIDKEGENYKHFVENAYGTATVLKNLVKTTKEFADHEKIKRQKEWENRMQSLKWIVSAADSVPLFKDESLKSNRFKPLVIAKDDFTLGLKYGADSVASGYFFSITPSRIPDIKASFPVAAVGFKKRNLPIIKGLGTRDDKKQVYFALIYSEAKVKDRFTVIIAKIYRSDGLAWSHTYLFEMIPSVISYVPEAGELSVKITSPAGDSKIVVIDKMGKQIQ
jgi:hypothetical protein